MIFLNDEGIIIGKKDIEEADRILTVFMRDYGKVSLFVKGIRKSKKRDKTAADLISLTKFLFYRKNESFILSGFEGLNDYRNIKADFFKLNIIFYMFSILNQILVENGRNIELYNLIINSLEFLEKSEDEIKNYKLIVYFLYKIMENEGIINKEEKNVNLFLVGKFENNKLSENQKKILTKLVNNQIKAIIDDGIIKKDELKSIILILENYLNFNLDIYIDMRNFLWGDAL